MRFLYLLALVPLVGACFLTTEVECTLIAVAGVRAEVGNSATGEVLSGATVVAREGEYEEELGELAPGEYVGVYERPGRYEISVSKPGFTGAVHVGLRVEGDECHVRTSVISVRLIPLGEG